jgi:hypothetical protein
MAFPLRRNSNFGDKAKTSSFSALLKLEPHHREIRQ